VLPNRAVLKESQRNWEEKNIWGDVRESAGARGENSLTFKASGPFEEIKKNQKRRRTVCPEGKEINKGEKKKAGRGLRPKRKFH